jgi:pimeloyl-ACP methyl ester carboxylesterase
MLATVLHFLDNLIPNEQFVVCGYSYGALIARGIVHFRRNLVRGLFLFAPLIIAEPAERVLPERQILREDLALISRLSSEEANEFESIAVLQGEQEWERFRDEILIPSKRANDEFLERIRRNGYGFTFDIDANTPPFEHPTLIITGRQDHVVGFQDAWRLIDSYPRATFAVLDMAGHNLQIERPNVFEALVNDWLDRLESGPFREHRCK